MTQHWGYQPPPPPRRLNAMSVGALATAVFFPPIGIVLGIISLRQIRRTGEDGKGLAFAGIAIGIAFTAFIVLFLSLLWVFSDFITVPTQH